LSNFQRWPQDVFRKTKFRIAMGIVRRIFNYAISRDLLSLNPATGLEKPGTERKGERVLTRDEIKILWAETESADYHIRGLYRLLLLTGTRPKEVQSMQWMHIDEDVWTIPSENSKNKRKHQLYLTELAKTEVCRLQEYSGSHVYVFPGRLKNGHSKSVRLCHERLVEALGGERWTMRDLRRTVQTRMSEIGVRPDIVDRVLNHNVPGVRANYDHYNYFPEIKSALTVWSKRVGEIVSGSELAPE